MTTSQKLLNIRRKQGLSQRELAEKFGVSYVTLNRWEKEYHQPLKPYQDKIDDLYRRCFPGKKATPKKKTGT